MSNTTQAQYKKGDNVNYKGRAKSGAGVVAKVENSLRGVWYTVADKATGNEIKLRAAQLTAA